MRLPKDSRIWKEEGSDHDTMVSERAHHNYWGGGLRGEETRKARADESFKCNMTILSETAALIYNNSDYPLAAVDESQTSNGERPVTNSSRTPNVPFNHTAFGKARMERLVAQDEFKRR